MLESTVSTWSCCTIHLSATWAFETLYFCATPVTVSSVNTEDLPITDDEEGEEEGEEGAVLRHKHKLYLIGETARHRDMQTERHT